nr:uncharacterized protein LOC129036066 [Pongo pygmaeus]
MVAAPNVLLALSPAAPSGRFSVTALVAPNFSVAEPLFSEGRHFLRDNTVGCAKMDVVLGNSSGWRHSGSRHRHFAKPSSLGRDTACSSVPPFSRWRQRSGSRSEGFGIAASCAESGVSGRRRRWAGEPAAPPSQRQRSCAGAVSSQRPERRLPGSGSASRTQSPGGAAGVSVAGRCGFARRWLLGPSKFRFRGACYFYLLSKSLAKM